MNFILKLSLSEIIKNKSKVLIAIIVTLILFMSAFTLCNISTALPQNFYSYYEEFMPGTIGITITNADEELYNQRDIYFESFLPNFSKACSNYSLVYGQNEQLSYDDTNTSFTIYYNNKFVSEENEAADAEMYAEFFSEEVGGSGNVWNDTMVDEGIWIADFAAQNLGVAVGDILKYKFVDNNIELVIEGIFNSEKLKQFEISQSGSTLVNDTLCFITEASAKKILFESGTTFDSYGVVGKIDKLYGVYNLLSSRYSLSEGAAFGLVKHVKNTQIICMIVGVIMIVCGIIIMLNFINMIISQNIKHLSLLRILGTNTFRICLAYYLIFILMITVVCVVSWMTLPLYNYIVSLYCLKLGYSFAIGINYWVVLGVFAFCYLVTSLVMLIKWHIFDKTAPIVNISEED